jgi:hypothetical protein
MIKIWADAAEVGLLDRHGERGSTFTYLPELARARAVSVRCQFDWNHGASHLVCSRFLR